MGETKSGERAGLACPPRAPAVALLPGLIQGCLPGSSRLGDGGGAGGGAANVSAPAGMPCVCLLSWLPCFLSQNGRIRIFSASRKILNYPV